MTAKVIDFGGGVLGGAEKVGRLEADAASRSTLRRRKAWEFWAYFAATYPIFLVVAVLSRALPRRMRPFGAERRNVFQEAKAAAFTVLPFVFKG